MSANDNKWIQSIDSIEIYAYEPNKKITHWKEESKCNSITKQYKKMINYDVTRENINKNNLNWPLIPDHL